MSKFNLYTRNMVFTDFVEFCRDDMGVDLKPFAKTHKVKINPAPGLNYIDFNEFSRFFEGLAEASGDPRFGVKWALASPRDFRTSGPVFHLFNRALTYRGSINALLDYARLFTNGLKFSYEENPEAREFTGRITVHPMATMSRQFVEHCMAITAQWGFMAFSDVVYKKVSFQHNGDPHDPAYFEAFKCPVEFNASENALIGDARYLDRKMKKANPVVRAGLNTYVNFQLARNKVKDQSIKVVVGAVLPELLGVQKSDIASVAAALDISAKKLQRLLRDEKTTYTEILDEVRRNLAERLLKGSEITLTDIARALDYASQETFIQAFRRWHDITPTEYRQRFR